MSYDYTIDDAEMPEGLTVRIVPDTDPTSPREWCQLGIMYCWHPDYELGDEQFTRDDHDSMEAVACYLRDERKAICILPLFLYDHSGITISAGEAVNVDRGANLSARGRFIGDGAGWDTTMVGFIYATAERVAEIGTPEDLIEQALRAEVEEYATYLEGGVVGFIVGDDEDSHIESCWGFYELEHAMSEGKATAQGIIAERKAEREQAAYWASRDVVTEEQ